VGKSSILLSGTALLVYTNISANFLWPALGAYRGFFDFALWLSIIFGFGIELFFLKKLAPSLALKSVFMVTFIMNIVSAFFGAVFMSLIDISLQHLFGISWLWHMLIIYVVTIVVNVCVEGFVCLRFWPLIDKQKLISVLTIANALSVGVGLLVSKLL